jgi:hypothetical protein
MENQRLFYQVEVERNQISKYTKLSELALQLQEDSGAIF